MDHVTRTGRMPFFFEKRQIQDLFKPKMLSICEFYFQEAPSLLPLALLLL